MRPVPDPVSPGQESVWDYPRPPIITSTDRHLRIVHAGEPVAETSSAQRVLETSHPPTYYFPPEAVREGVLQPHPKRSMCEWKGQAHYWNVRVGGQLFEAVAWSYPQPTPGSGLRAGAIAFYADPFDEVTVDGEQVVPQPGGFYGGWITSHVAGPFKGIPGSWGW